jgi:preprotein translocase subunit SecD
MDRGWYVRLGVFVLAISLGWLTLWPSIDAWVPAPAWVKRRFPGRIAPGLDIRGGLRLVYEVEVDEAIRDLRDTRADQLFDAVCVALGECQEDEAPTREQREKTRERVTPRKVGDRRFTFTFKTAEDAAKLTGEIIDRFGDIRETERQGLVVTIDMRGDRLERIREEAVEQAKNTISDRIDGLGLREAAVTARDNDVIVEIPGADESAFDRIRNIISQTARLEFKIVDDDATYLASLTDLPEGVQKGTETTSAGTARPQVNVTYLYAEGDGARETLQRYVDELSRRDGFPEGRELLLGRFERDDGGSRPRGQGTPKPKEGWRTYLVFERADVTGDMIEDAFVANDPQTNKPYVALSFTKPQGADTFERLTGQNVKRRFAIVLDDRVESAPVIQTRIGGGRAQITLGGFRDYNTILNEARDLVIVLKAGALPAPIRPSNEQLIGPTLGRDAVQQGAYGALVGVGLVLLFMALYYQVAGLIADLMVVINLLLLFAILGFFEASLTLPGIAGIALTVGMAVDANVLITERIREELRAGKSARTAVEQGFARAFWSIFDSQLTTAIAGIVLLQYGTGPIKGFAVTLLIGIVTSLFTGVFCSRIAFEWLVRGLRVQNLRVG